ncbi:MAG: SAM-dependent chlorinase/fluorinase, partial [Krumholzibacteria bacterium]|nr:SAM-dependent chlorinase/fluorinase [Candidatus Krumholzibacteria bacterium]
QVGSPAAPGVLGAAPAPAEGFTIRWIDRFGNAVTDLGKDTAAGRRLVRGGRVGVGAHDVDGPFATYAAAPRGVPFWYWGSGGTLEIALAGGDAAALLGLHPGLVLKVPRA